MSRKKGFGIYLSVFLLIAGIVFLMFMNNVSANCEIYSYPAPFDAASKGECDSLAQQKCSQDFPSLSPEGTYSNGECRVQCVNFDSCYSCGNKQQIEPFKCEMITDAATCQNSYFVTKETCESFKSFCTWWIGDSEQPEGCASDPANACDECGNGRIDGCEECDDYDYSTNPLPAATSGPDKKFSFNDNPPYNAGECIMNLPDDMGNSCKLNRCGDGYLDKSLDAGGNQKEECDDGNTDNSNKCSNLCKANPKILSGRFYIDPAYRAKTKAQRLFDPGSYAMTPFDDVICEVTTDMRLPEGYSLRGRIMSHDAFVQNFPTYLGGYLVSSSELNNGNPVYRWRISGWRNGWFDFGMEDLIKNVRAGHKVICKVNMVKDSDPYNSVDTESYNPEPGFSLCVKLLGDNSQIPITMKGLDYVGMRGRSNGLSPRGLVENEIGIYKNGFQKIDPFGSNLNAYPTLKKYKELSEYYVDLVEYDDSSFPISPNKYFAPSVFASLSEGSICKGGNLYNFHYGISHFLEVGTRGYSHIGSRTIFTLFFADPSVSVHETGHAFCRLYDEYVYNNSIYNETHMPPNGLFSSYYNNCRLPPSFSPYGNNNHPGCSLESLYRPSQISLMNYLPTPLIFNSISCGYCLHAFQPNTVLSEQWTICRDRMVTLGPTT